MVFKGVYFWPAPDTDHVLCGYKQSVLTLVVWNALTLKAAALQRI